ncbi:cysteine-rich receptor-like protein kinase 44 [Silene latifolia]|uniref:cysteine-rich receptor-like protein kinase 44 n=1 Tax=Silene latifolia TaxID=37657 RepID=UPI003D76CDA8
MMFGSFYVKELQLILEGTKRPVIVWDEAHIQAEWYKPIPNTAWTVRAHRGSTRSANDSGFALQEGESRGVAVPSQWNGHVWGRTLCSTNKSNGNFSCQTGDCTTGNIQCASSPYVNPATRAEFALGLLLNSEDSYDVSVVDGYNLPLLVAPHVDSGPECEVTGCVFDLEKSCQLAELRVVSKSNDSIIIGCKSPCDVFSTDQFCCSSGADCQRSNFSLASLIFKRPCPRAYSYVLDDATSVFTCNGSRVSSYDITFCPSLAMSRLLSIPASQTLPPPLAPELDTSSPIPISPTTNSATKPTHQDLPSNTSKRKVHTAILIAGLTAAGISILGLFGVYLCISKKKAIKKFNVQTDEMKRLANSLQFDFTTIRLATQNFAAENKLGEGGFGEVYKGVFEGGQEVAVKRLSKRSAQGIVEFETEIVLVAGLQHKNLVKLLGYCASPNESILVYKFLPNSSLDKFLFDPAKKSSLDWQTRFNIICGIARGLRYLHEDSRIKVVHRDLKSSNILLDEAMDPKIADFGLARLFEVDQTRAETERIAGTYGYMAPEYAIKGRYSVKSDVYSFGVIVLEIVSGQRNRSFGRLQLDEALLHRAWRLWNEDEPLNLIDTELGDNFEQEKVLKCIKLGLLCIQENAIDRPRMTSIVSALSGATRLPTPKPPQFFGCAVEDEARDMTDAYATPYVHTGDEFITNVYSRD